MKVKFWGVGNGRWTGTVNVKDGADLERAVLREAKKHLASKAIEIAPSDGAAPGLLTVGALGRVVGYFRYET